MCSYGRPSLLAEIWDYKSLDSIFLQWLRLFDFFFFRFLFCGGR